MKPERHVAAIGFGVIDRYLFALMLPRMVLALAITLAALVIERVLRLFDFVTSQGAAIGPVLSMAANLLPHYLGLALPAAFCIGVLGALRSLATENEIDALEAAGLSLWRISVPFLGCAVVLSMLSILLFGVVQPYSRYAYYEIRHQVLSAGWDGRVQEGMFLNVGDGMTLSAASIDASGRALNRVFLVREDERGRTAMTARRGVVIPDIEHGKLHLVLEDGRSLLPNGERLQFERLQIRRDFDLFNNPFRPRGENQNELTMAELWERMHAPAQADAQLPFAVEFHDRLIRAISIIGVALMSIPLAVTRKRTPGWQRIALAVAILALYDNLIKFISGLGKIGTIDPALGLWGLAICFNGFALWLYLATPGQGAQTPLRWLLRTQERRSAKAAAARVFQQARIMEHRR